MCGVQEILHIGAPELALAIPLGQHSGLLIGETPVDLGHGFLQFNPEECTTITVSEDHQGVHFSAVKCPLFNFG